MSTITGDTLDMVYRQLERAKAELAETLETQRLPESAQRSVRSALSMIRNAMLAIEFSDQFPLPERDESGVWS